MAGLFNFLARNYTASPLEMAKKQVKKDPKMQRVLEVLDTNPNANAEEIASVLSSGGGNVTADVVRTYYLPRAKQLLQEARDQSTALVPASSKGNKPASKERGQDDEIVINIPPPGADQGPISLDQLEEDAVALVSKANTGVGLDNYLKKAIIFVFKTFGPLAVLALTIPESIWVFIHIYTHPDGVLSVLTGIFAVLTDFGYLYLTVLVSMNKEALFKRRRSGMEVEAHEKRAVRLQSVLWWCVAGMDMVAQVVFLYGATQNSTFFNYAVVLALAGVRILSLFMTMFIVSFAGTELMTSIDKTANEQVERANAVGKVLSAMGEARLRRQEARAKLQRAVELQQLQREGDKLLAEIYADARERIRQRHLNADDSSSDQKKLP